MEETNGSNVSPSVVVKDVRDMEAMVFKSSGEKACSGPAGATGVEEKADVVSEEVCESIKKGMKIVSDVEQTRADGTRFKFEVDLMYAVSKRELKPVESASMVDDPLPRAQFYPNSQPPQNAESRPFEPSQLFLHARLGPIYTCRC